MAVHKLIIVPGMRFNRLTIVREVEPRITHYPSQKTPGKKRRVEAECQCGVMKTYDLCEITAGHTKSCGCYSIEMATERALRLAKHHMKGSPEYVVWVQMRVRCRDPKHHAWADYGGRGIKVCDRWQKFENFYEDMGPRPIGFSIDRWPDKDGDYEPNNCRWATSAEQCNNRRNNVMLEHDGKNLSVAQWARVLNVKAGTLYSRVRKGYSTERVLTKHL